MLWGLRRGEHGNCKQRQRIWSIRARLCAYVARNRNLKLIRTSPLFNREWYLASYSEVMTAGTDPAFHYLTQGAAEHRNPGPTFDTAWYLAYYTDVARAGINPLVHYIRHGAKEGRHRNPSEIIATEVTKAAIECRKVPPGSGEIALFVTHSSDGRMKAYVRHYLEALNDQGITTVLIIATDEQLPRVANEPLPFVGGLYLRQNIGYDFAAWAHVLRIAPHLLNADILYLINDSMIGPLNKHKFETMLSRVRGSDGDMVGLTDSHEQTWHIQTYFIALKRRALRSDSLRNFIGAIKALSTKRDVITNYETNFARTLRQAGLTCEVLFPTNTLHNPVLKDWRFLVAAGLPFIKLAAIRQNSGNSAALNWRTVLRSEGYDCRLAEQALTRHSE